MTVGSVAALLPCGVGWHEGNLARLPIAAPDAIRPHIAASRKRCWRFSKAVAGAHKCGRRIDNPPDPGGTPKNLPHNCAENVVDSSTGTKKNRIGSVPRRPGLNPMRLAQVGLEIQRRRIWLHCFGPFLVRSASYFPYQKRLTTTATDDPRRETVKAVGTKNPSAATAKGRTVS